MWCSNQQPLHCAFSLERFSPAATQLSCKISVRQVKGHEQILQVYTAVAEVRRAHTHTAFVSTARRTYTECRRSAPANSLHRRGTHYHLLLHRPLAKRAASMSAGAVYTL